MSYTEFLIQPFGPSGLSQLLNYDIIEFPEEGNPNSSNQIEFRSHKSGRGWMVSTPKQETLQLRALKLQTPIKGTFPLSSFTLRLLHCYGWKWQWQFFFTITASYIAIKKEEKGRVPKGTQYFERVQSVICCHILTETNLEDPPRVHWCQLSTWACGKQGWQIFNITIVKWGGKSAFTKNHNWVKI